MAEEASGAMRCNLLDAESRATEVEDAVTDLAAIGVGVVLFALLLLVSSAMDRP